MDDHWGLLIDVIGCVCFIAGLFSLKRGCGAVWSLKNRSYFRNGIIGSIQGYRFRYDTGVLNQIGFFQWMDRITSHNKKEKMDKEIFESILFLRNIASIRKGRNLNTDSVIQYLAEQSGTLHPIYVKMLSLLRLNKPNEAAALFSEKVGTPASKDFARILLQWEKIDPEELSETLLSQEKSMKEIRITAQKRKDEVISDLIYFPVIVNILLIFINFIYVAYFIDQKEMMQMFIV